MLIEYRLGAQEAIAWHIDDLSRSGSRYVGLCPFDTEKTPSFVVNPEKGLWYCHGCHKGGDVITFVEISEGLTFRQALASARRVRRRNAVSLWRWSTEPL